MVPEAAPAPSAHDPGHPADRDQPAAGDAAAGLVIEHHQQSTLVHGTQKNDHQLRRMLRNHGFRWSGNLNAWFLPRPWTFSTRAGRVSSLTTDLRQAHRSFTMRTQPPVPAGTDDQAELLYPASAAAVAYASDKVHARMRQPGTGDAGTSQQQPSAGQHTVTPVAGPDTPDEPGTIPAAADEPAATAGETTPLTGPEQQHAAGPPAGTQPLAAHTGWAGDLRPERLLYADGTPLTIRGQGDDNDQMLPATAAGTVPAPADSDYGPGRLQVVRWDDGRYAIIHPALASPVGIDAYAGLSDRDRARWEAFDLAEAWPTATAGLPPRLVDVGDVPRSRARAAQPHRGPARGAVDATREGRTRRRARIQGHGSYVPPVLPAKQPGPGLHPE